MIVMKNFAGIIFESTCRNIGMFLMAKMNPDNITDGSHVYKSDDAGASFGAVADASLPALDGNELITSLDVGYDASDDPYLFLTTADTDAGDFGGIYYLPEAAPGAEWTDL